MHVAVIGAGPAGLVAAKNSLSEGYNVTVYEQESEEGGIWHYSPRTDCHSAMYEQLLTNIPKQMMALRGRPYKAELPSFLPREAVLEYFKEYGRGIKILFNSKVVNVRREKDKWKITTESGRNITENVFDVVFVCSGHHFAPRSHLNISMFKGEYLHSRIYRSPNKFKGKRVGIVGAGFSGVDIALQVATVTSQVFLIGQHAVYTKIRDEITQVPHPVAAIGTDYIVLENGERIEDIEVIIDCRGYRWEFPFLSKDLIQIFSNGRMISPLWLFFAHREYPTSLFFIGLNDMTLQLRVNEMEVSFALSLVAGRIPIPSIEEMKEWEERRIRYLHSEGKTTEYFHVLVEEQFAHIEELCVRGGLPEMEDIEAVKKLDKYVDEQRRKDPGEYKKMEFRWNGEEYEILK